ncbi:ABC-2 type transport system permease protein [Massilia sp. UYP11]|uniref:putative ABC transporter permease subunit n=1 Tax=Massilia sp. UYP11 TaxID=1756385 RepID=UPI003D254FF9
MRAAPGGVGWLLRHELRLAWFNAAGGKKDAGKRRPGNAAIGLALFGWAALHLLAWVGVRALAGVAGDDPRILLAISAALAGGATFMLSSAIKSCVLVLFERSDLDLLLSSPLPSHSIFAVRLAGVAASTAAVYLFFLAPFAHAGLLQGQWRWLGIYPGVISVAVLCSCAAMLLTLGLVRMFGARRTRVVAQVIGALAGALLVIASQLHALSSRDSQGRARQVLDGLLRQDGMSEHPLLLPARAMLGEPLPMLLLATLAAVVFALTARRTHRFFARGLQLAASAAHAGAAPTALLPRSLRFGRSLFYTVVVKEWRLIVRDPHLLSQVLLQLLFLLPLLFLIFQRADVQVQALGAGLTMLCGSLTGALAWIALSAEDAPDLLLASPASLSTVRRAKLAAAVMPVLALVAVPLLWLTVRTPAAGLAVGFTVCGAVLGAGLIVFWCGRPGVRSNFKGRGKGGIVMNMLELFNNLAWGALGWFLAGATRAPLSDVSALAVVGSGALAVVVLGAAWLLKVKRI